MRRHLPSLLAIVSLLMCVAAAALWVRSRSVADYLVLRDGDFDGCHVSIARGDLRLARGSWRGPHGERVFSLPIDRVGDYSRLKSIYIPLWTVMVPSGAASLVFGWWSRRQQVRRLLRQQPPRHAGAPEVPETRPSR